MHMIRGPTQKGGGIRGLNGFEGTPGAEVHVCTLVDTKKYVALSFFPKNLQVRRIGTRGDIPFHIADVITFPIFTNFLEIQS